APHVVVGDDGQRAVAERGVAGTVQDEALVVDLDAGRDAAVVQRYAALQFQGGAVAVHQRVGHDDGAIDPRGNQLRLIDTSEAAAKGDRVDVARLIHDHRTADASDGGQGIECILDAGGRPDAAGGRDVVRQRCGGRGAEGQREGLRRAGDGKAL